MNTKAAAQPSASQSRYQVAGMDCASCATKIETALRRLDGVKDVNVSVSAGTLTVGHDDRIASVAIADQVTKLGYQVRPNDREAAGNGSSDPHNGTSDLHSHIGEAGGHDGPWWRSPKALLVGACGLGLVVAFLFGKLVPAGERWAFMAAMAIGLVPIARRAFVAARYGTPFSIEMLMTIAAVGAVVIGATEEAAVVVFLFLIGELLEGVAAGRARASIRGLAALVPKTALLETDGVTREVDAESLAIGSIILVRPGDRIPADGLIESGESAIDEAPVTGESVPKRKGVGDPVFAGTVNHDAVLRIKVTATATDNTIARVVRLVEEAQESKAPTERFIDRFSRYYTPAVVVAGALTATVPPLLFGAAWGEWTYKALALLLIGCPCALVISTPAAIAAGLAAGARRGLLMKGGAVLETLGTMTVVALDKTGTLTAGKPQVTDVVAFTRSEKDVLSLAAALETGSSHPLATAILSYAAAQGVPVPPASGAAAIGGKGVSGSVGGTALFLGSPQAATERVPLSAEQLACVVALNNEGKSTSVLLAGNEVVGLIAMRDEPRPDANSGLDALKALGIRPLMLTGDNRQTAAAIAGQLGLEARGELLPQDKLRIVEELKNGGEIVGKVGDGINDAPALAAAHVGIAMGGGTDVALETADAAILHSRVADVPAMVKLSRIVMANIRQNITISLGLKAVFLFTTLIGVTGLWPAILADTGATVLVTANAIRLLKVRL